MLAVFTQPLDYAVLRIIEGLGKNSHVGFKPKEAVDLSFCGSGQIFGNV